MKWRFILFIFFLIPALVFGQKKKYQYQYREHLINQPSTYTVKSTDTVMGPDKCNLTFTILDNKGEVVPFANIRIKSSKTDTIVHSDFNGAASVILPPEIFTISVNALPFTTIQLDSVAIKVNTKTTVNTSLVISNDLRIALIYSVRKLTDNEIEEIVDDLSNDRDNELIKSKICYVVWEI